MFNNTLGYLKIRNVSPLNILIVFLLLFGLVGFLSIRGATNACLYLLLLTSLFHVKKGLAFISQADGIKLILPILVTFSLPIFAIFISQLGRQDWLFKAYDGPSRMLIAIPVLFLLSYRKIKFSYLIGIASPLAIFTSALTIYLHPEIVSRWGERFATTFVDPTAFGPYIVILTGFCLFHLDVTFKSSKLWFLYQTLGVITGLFLITGSGTRGSWLAIPAILGIWLFFNFQKLTRPFYIFSIFLLVFFTLGASIYFPQAASRFISGYTEITNWFNQSSLDSATGLRLSMWKISWQLFLHHPLFGYGDQGISAYLNKPWFSATATSEAKATIACCGPHNELIANALRSGVIGVFSTLALFIIPFVFFIKNARHYQTEVARASHLGLAYIACMIISSLSAEVFTLKFTSSFYAIIVTGLLAQIINSHLTADKQ